MSAPCATLCYAAIGLKFNSAAIYGAHPSSLATSGFLLLASLNTAKKMGDSERDWIPQYKNQNNDGNWKVQAQPKELHH